MYAILNHNEALNRLHSPTLPHAPLSLPVLVADVFAHVLIEFLILVGSKKYGG